MAGVDTDTTVSAVRLVIVDDHAPLVSSLALLLDRDRRIEVVGTARDGVEALDVALATAPDVVLIDVEMPKMNGIEATRRLRALLPRARVVVMSGVLDEELERRARRAGADGVVAKEEFANDLRGVVADLASGRRAAAV